jgi:segregation and condensation protein B
MELVSIVEALLFASQEPLPLGQMAAAVRETARDIHEGAEGGAPAPEWVAPLLNVDEVQIRGALDTLVARYQDDGRAFTVVERSTGWRLCARSEYAEWCRALYPGRKPQRLSQPALETLAIIAYRQPVTKAGIEAVRGVSVDAMVQQLIDRGMVRIEGRAELPGRPLLYGTTDAFLDHFGVRSLDELPNAGELRRMPLPDTGEPQAPPALEGSEAAPPEPAPEPEPKELQIEPQPEEA